MLAFTEKQTEKIKGAVDRAGYDFVKLCGVKLFPQVAYSYLKGDYNEKKFVEMLGKINIFNQGKLLK